MGLCQSAGPNAPQQLQRQQHDCVRVGERRRGACALLGRVERLITSELGALCVSHAFASLCVCGEPCVAPALLTSDPLHQSNPADARRPSRTCIRALSRKCEPPMPAGSAVASRRWGARLVRASNTSAACAMMEENCVKHRSDALANSSERSRGHWRRWKLRATETADRRAAHEQSVRSVLSCCVLLSRWLLRMHTVLMHVSHSSPAAYLRHAGQCRDRSASSCSNERSGDHRRVRPPSVHPFSTFAGAPVNLYSMFHPCRVHIRTLPAC
jgi:hypothetical protein